MNKYAPQLLVWILCRAATGRHFQQLVSVALFTCLVCCLAYYFNLDLARFDFMCSMLYSNLYSLNVLNMYSMSRIEITVVE